MEDQFVKKPKVFFARLDDLYLCPGNGDGEHVTDNATACGCGNSNVYSLARLLSRETTVASVIDIALEDSPELMKQLNPHMKVAQG